MITIVYVMMIYAKNTAICEIEKDGISKTIVYTIDNLPRVYRDYMKRDDIAVETNYEDDELQTIDIFFIEKSEEAKENNND